MVQVADVLDFLVAKSQAPSTMGAQLERLKYGIQIAPDPFRQREDVESHLLKQAGLIRCVDDFADRQEFNPPRKVDSAGYKIILKIQKETRPQRAQGAIALGILRAYHERCTGVNNQERGLLEVYNFILSIAPRVVPSPPKNTDDLLMAFRTGTAKRARATAAEGYADALLALQNHCRVWNKKGGVTR